MPEFNASIRTFCLRKNRHLPGKFIWYKKRSKHFLGKIAIKFTSIGTIEHWNGMRARSFVEVLICAHRQRWLAIPCRNSQAWQQARKFFIFTQKRNSNSDNNNSQEMTLRLYSVQPAQLFCIPIRERVYFMFSCEDCIRIWIWIACSSVHFIGVASAGKCVRYARFKNQTIPRNFASIRGWCVCAIRKYVACFRYKLFAKRIQSISPHEKRQCPRNRVRA